MNNISHDPVIRVMIFDLATEIATHQPRGFTSYDVSYYQSQIKETVERISGDACQPIDSTGVKNRTIK